MNCIRCNIELTIENSRISKNKNTDYRCNHCILEYAKKYRLENAEKLKENRLDNNEKLRCYQNQYYLNNAENLKEARRKKYLDNPIKYKKAWSNYCLENQEIRKESSKIYRLKNHEAIKKRKSDYNKTPKGKVVSKRARTKRIRNLGFNPLNIYFKGSHGHHINRVDVIYIPSNYHIEFYGHMQKNPLSMIAINYVAMFFLLQQNIDTIKNYFMV